ncbi:hypothetical protein [Runella slithyformis]|uniref:Uncharacterized protein n=1 Tax=Runella slithyformis (strain ATCC 29530 / DSM 19594 / LMG 11500 / NCIMB 11436 / LSU 4) TaxID=761193 RepID=A0A7U3ZRC3_RUNSL|nr:hypothetical protein [Runella slithyformis]AEI51931.1 hypothetical protein Runsl_5642 [Runella slithyformis DSM 19594]
MKIGITASIIASAVLIAKYYTDSHIELAPPVSMPTLKALPRTQAALVYFEHEPDPNRYEDQQLQLRLERRTDNRLYLVDDSKPEQGRTVYYTLNGSVNQVDARQLTQQPLLPNRWIHLVKYVTEVSNVNSESWLTSALNVAAGQAKFAAAYEAIFWVRDSLQKTTSKLTYTQPLWPNNGAVGDSKIFKQTPAFTLLNKKYGSESLPLDEPVENLKKVSWNVSPGKFRLLYAGEVDGLIKHIKPQHKRGITRFDSKQLDQAADWLAKSNSSDIFSVDFEPGNPEDGWYWDMSDPNFGKTMYELSDRIYKRHGKLFYSWMGDATTFEFKGKTFTLDGYANDNWSAGKKNIDDYLAIHQDTKSIQNVKVPYPSILMTGFGYTSSTVNTNDTNDQPAQVWKSPVNWYLRTLDMLNLQTLVVPQNIKFLNFIWPYEDKPVDARRSYTRRFRVGNGTKGYVRQLDNRVMYPMNLVRDAVFVHLCNPRVFYTNYWIFGQSYNPYQALRYSKINGTVSCESTKLNGYFVYEYEGPDQPACPSVSEDYMGKDALGVAAMVQAHELFAKYQYILDGTQTRESYGLTYQRSAQGTQKAVWQNDTGEFARAFKHNQPWLQVWKNPKTGRRLLLFQDNFAEAFEPVSFSTTINGKKIQRIAQGNALYVEEIAP